MQGDKEGSPPKITPKPPEAATFTIVASQQTTVEFRGPLPPPEILQAYNKALPNGAERIVAMAERQSAHRQEIEKTVVKGNVTVQKIGVFSSLLITLTAISLGSALIYNDKDTSGLAVIISSLACLVGAFIYGRRSQERERAEKAKLFHGES